MKTKAINDLYKRVQQTVKMKRRRLLNYDDNNPLTTDFYGFEIFEFLIFLEVRNKVGYPVLHFPITVAHEPILGEIMREQLAIYCQLLPPTYSLAAVAIENSLVTYEEWESLPVYSSPQDVTDAISLALETDMKFSKKYAIDTAYLENNQSGEYVSDETKVVIEKIEVSRFSEDEDSEPMPLVISVCRPA